MKKIKKLIITAFFCLIVMQAPVFASTKSIEVTLKKNTSNISKSVSVGKYKIKARYNSIILYDDVFSSSSTNPSVAEYKNGYLRVKKAGKATITLKYNSRKAKIKLTVKKPSSHVAVASSLRQKIVSYAKSFVGKLPYVYGGDSLKTGTDCSGFIHLIYQKYGYDVPRSASEFQSISNTTYENLEPGDVVVYKNGGHVAMYIGNDEVVHAQGTAYGTRKTSMWYNSPTGYVKILK